MYLQKCKLNFLIKSTRKSGRMHRSIFDSLAQNPPLFWLNLCQQFAHHIIVSVLVSQGYSKKKLKFPVFGLITEHNSGGSRISQRRGANPKGGAPTYYLANFSWKLHENEEILGQRGDARPSPPPLDPPLSQWHNDICALTYYCWSGHNTTFLSLCTMIWWPTLCPLTLPSHS